jgi:hypothetical protein
MQQQEKIRLLREALSLVRVTIEVDPLKSLSFVPVSETLRGIEPEDIPPPKAILMDSEMFKVLWRFIRRAVVLVVPAGKETVSLREVEVYATS